MTPSPAPPPFHADLLGRPDASGMRDPLPGVDSSVDPDGPALRTSSAKLGKKHQAPNKRELRQLQGCP